MDKKVSLKVFFLAWLSYVLVKRKVNECFFFYDSSFCSSLVLRVYITLQYKPHWTLQRWVGRITKTRGVLVTFHVSILGKSMLSSLRQFKFQLPRWGALERAKLWCINWHTHSSKAHGQHKVHCTPVVIFRFGSAVPVWPFFAPTYQVPKRIWWIGLIPKWDWWS